MLFHVQVCTKVLFFVISKSKIQEISDKISTYVQTLRTNFSFSLKLFHGGVENLFYDIRCSGEERWIFHFSFLLGIEMEQRLRSIREAAITQPGTTRPSEIFQVDRPRVASGPPLNWLSKPNCGSSARWRAPFHDKLINGNGFPNTDSRRAVVLVAMLTWIVGEEGLSIF